MSEIEYVLEQAMTVQNLMDELRDLDPHAPVVIVSDYGDRGHTQQALAVESVDLEDRCLLKETAYSQSGIALIDPADGELTVESESGPPIVALR